MERIKIAIIIKTFNRPTLLLKCIDSIKKYCTVPYRIYLADDSELTAKIEQIHKSLVAEGHFVRHFVSRISVTSARNYLIDKMENEQFVLRLDDDFILGENTDIETMLMLLNEYTQIGAISDLEKQLGDNKGLRSGEISPGQGFCYRDGKTLVKVNIPVDKWLWQEYQGKRYAIAGFTRNFLLIRREVFETVRWNENLFFSGEHLDFMLTLQRAGWLLAFTPDSMHYHDDLHKEKSEQKDKRICRKDLKNAEFVKKFGIRKVVSKRIDRDIFSQSYIKVKRFFK